MKITSEDWVLKIGPFLDPVHGWGPFWGSPLKEAWEAWDYDGDALDDVLRLMAWAEGPLRRTPLFHDWKDATNPLGSLLEVLAGARVAGLHGIFPSVVAAQFLHEAGSKPDRKAPLGIKATRKDLEAGTWAELSTLEVLKPSSVAALAAAGKVEAVLRTLPDGRQEIKCLQKFHYEPGLKDDMLKVVDVYENFFDRYKKPRPAPGWTPAEFLAKVTQAPPAYATGQGYVEKVLHYIGKYRLDDLDSALVLPT